MRKSATVFWGLAGLAFTSVCLYSGSKDPAAPAEMPDKPGLAYEYRRLSWLDENGQIAPDAFLKAYDQRDANLALWEAAGVADSAAWVERGPNNIMGRTRSLLINPSNPSIMFAGTVGGGVWKTTNAGATWAPLDDRFKSIAIGCMAMDPANSNTMYAGTGEGFFNGDAVVGAGIYKTTDGGGTWTLMPSTASFGNVNRIAICPTNGNLILVSTRNEGILRSADGGATWTNPFPAYASLQAVWHPTDPNKAVANIVEYDGANYWQRALYSTNAGVTWNVCASGLNAISGRTTRIELAYAPSSPSIVYAACSASSGQIWKSTDGGLNFADVTTSGTTGSNWYASPIWVDPTNANFIVVGGTYFYKSTNGGATVTKISDGYIMTANAHPDCHQVIPHPGYNGSSNKTVFVATDGGIYKAADISTASTTAGWVNLDQSCRTTQYYGAAGDGTSGRIVAGTQDNGHHTLDTGSNNAVLTFGGDGGFAAIDWTNPQYGYGEYVYAQIHRSSNGGASASYIYTGIGDAGSSANSNFIAPFILDPNNANTMLIGGVQLWRSTNVKSATPTWTSIRASQSDKLSAIAVAPGNSNIIFTGTNGGLIQKTINGTNAAPTWTDVDNNAATNPMPNRKVQRIVVDLANPNIIYACFGGFSPDNVWKSTNGGTSWADITGSGVTGLPDAPVRGFARHPSQPNWLFAGTEVGFFQSTDGGANWSTSAFGPANVSVDELAFMHNSYTLLAATHGRGLWTADLPDPNVAAATLTMVRGTVTSGAVANAAVSDDSYLTMRPGAVFSNSEFPIQAVLEATSPFQTPGALSFTVEAQASASSIQQGIDLYNFVTGVYDQFDLRTATLTDSTVTVNAGAASANYVQAGTKLVRAKVRWKATAAVFVYPWLGKIDLAKWTIWP